MRISDLTAATHPFHPTKTTLGPSAHFPNLGSFHRAQPGPGRPKGVRCAPADTTVPAPALRGGWARRAEPEGRPAWCLRKITDPPELRQRPRLSPHKSVTGRRGRGGGNGAAEGERRRADNSDGRRAALPLRDRHRRRPSRRISSRNNSSGAPAATTLRSAAGRQRRATRPPGRDPNGHPDTHPPAGRRLRLLPRRRCSLTVGGWAGAAGARSACGR